MPIRTVRLVSLRMQNFVIRNVNGCSDAPLQVRMRIKAAINKADGNALACVRRVRQQAGGYG